jgi:hypothetical protein
MVGRTLGTVRVSRSGGQIGFRQLEWPQQILRGTGNRPGLTQCRTVPGQATLQDLHPFVQWSAKCNAPWWPPFEGRVLGIDRQRSIIRCIASG